MIHHGGTGSMQECAYFGVPMIVTYFSLFDGPGNAARVTSLGIGLMRDLRNITAQRIGEMVDHILRDQTWRIEARLLSDEIRREDSFGRLERVFDAILRARPVARSNESDHSGDKAPVAVPGNTGT